MGSRQSALPEPQQSDTLPSPEIPDINPIPPVQDARLWVSNFTQIQLLWAVQHSSMLGKLRFNVTREICSYLPQRPMLLAVFSKEVRYFDTVESTWRSLHPINKQVSVADRSVAIVLSDDQIFVCGGYNRRERRWINSTYILVRDGSVLTLPSMLDCRDSPGAIYDQSTGSVCVFGGAGPGRMKNCEKFVFSASKWESLGSMEVGRYSFNPCLYSSVVYLCGGFTQFVETYHLRENRFTLLPDLQVQRNSSCMAVVQSGALIIISADYIITWNLKTQTSLSRPRSHGMINAWSGCLPVISGGKMFIVDEEFCYWRIDVQTGEGEERVEKNNICTVFDSQSRLWERK